MTTNSSHAKPRASGVHATLLCLIGSAALCGCANTPPRVGDAPNASLRALEIESGAPQSDADRMKLARFIGVWSFRGTVTDEGGGTREVAGTAAGVLENSHFVLLDVEATQGAFAGETGRKSGSMLFGSEPGKGLTLTAWGDGAPDVRRLIGATNADGSAFEFRAMHGQKQGAGVSMRIVFETDDRWTATLTRHSGPARASYVFNRTD